LSEKLVGEIRDFHLTPQHRDERLPAFLQGVGELMGGYREGRVLGAPGSWAPVRSVDEAKVIVDRAAPLAGGRAAYRFEAGNVVLFPATDGLGVLLKLRDLGLAEAVAETPPVLLDILDLGEHTLHPDFAGPRIGIRQDLKDYPLPLPPADDFMWPCGMTWWVVDRRCQEQTEWPTAKPENVDRLASMELPAHIKRSQRGPYLVMDWGRTGATPPEYAIQRGAQHQWLRDTLGLALDNNYNASGDRLVSPGPTGADDYFTYYTANAINGPSAVKALIPTDTGDLDPEELAFITAMLKAGATPSGQALATASVVVPKREQALRVREQARRAGLEAVFYVASPGIRDPEPRSYVFDGKRLVDGPGWLHEVAPKIGYRATPTSDAT
jgi:hypothetical protein